MSPVPPRLPRTVRDSRLVPHRRDRERNRDALIRAAQSVFGARGISAPLDLVVVEARLSSATLYRHFATRELLLVEVYARTLADFSGAAARAAEAHDPWTAFVHQAGWVFERLSTDLTVVRALVSGSDGVDDGFDKAQATARQHLNDLVGAAQAQGRFRMERSSDDVILYFTAAEALMSAERHQGPQLARLRALMLDSVGTGSSRQPASD